MKKNILTALLSMFIVFNNTPVNAQYIYASYKTSAGNYPTFNLLVESYNKHHRYELDKPLENFKLLQGYSLNLNLIWGELGYHRMYGSTSAAFLNGDKRYFKMTSSYVDFLIDAAFGDDLFKVSALLGGYRGRINIDSYYEYANGTLDFSTNKLLNGTYKTNYEGYMGMLLGTKLQMVLSDRFRLFIRIERLFPLVAGELINKNATHHYILGLEPYLPTDYTHYPSILNNNKILPSEYRIKSDFRAYNFGIGVQIPFNFK